MRRLMGQLTLALLALFSILAAGGIRPALAAPPCATLASDPANAPWRRETADETRAKLQEARALIAAELAVTTR